MTEQEELALYERIRTLEYQLSQSQIALSVLKTHFDAFLREFQPDRVKSVYVGDELATRYVDI